MSVRSRRALREISKIWRLPLSNFRPGNIIMFHMGRCGSSVLGDLLNQHSKVYWDGEIYCQYIRNWRKQRQETPNISTVNLKPEALQLLKDRMIMAGSNFYGCEVNFNKFIVLIRRNFLRSIISNRVMHETPVKQTHIRSEDKTQIKKVVIDVNSIGYNGYKKNLYEHLEEHESNYKNLSILLANKQVLQLSYEDHISENPKSSYHEVCHFLDIKPKDNFVRLRKTNPFKISEMIINFGEVEKYLCETQFEWMLYD
jgi:Sulfotransferase domain